MLPGEGNKGRVRRREVRGVRGESLIYGPPNASYVSSMAQAARLAQTYLA